VCRVHDTPILWILTDGLGVTAANAQAAIHDTDHKPVSLETKGPTGGAWQQGDHGKPQNEKAFYARENLPQTMSDELVLPSTKGFSRKHRSDADEIITFLSYSRRFGDCQPFVHFFSFEAMTGGGKGVRSQAHVILRTPTQYITDYIARVKGFPGGTLWLFMVVPSGKPWRLPVETSRSGQDRENNEWKKDSIGVLGTGTRRSSFTAARNSTHRRWRGNRLSISDR